MGRKKSPEEIHYNMSRIRSKDSKIELMFEEELIRRGFASFEKNKKDVKGRPDFVFMARKVAVFCDGDFWHGYDWDNRKEQLRSNREFWINKIETNMARDRRIDGELKSQGWEVFRFWGHDIEKNLSECVDKVEAYLRKIPTAPYKTVDLCAGIGGMRKGFELTGQCVNVLSAETDRAACTVYRELFNEDPFNDIRSNEFKEKIKNLSYDILLSRLLIDKKKNKAQENPVDGPQEEPLSDHIFAIIRETRPTVVFIESNNGLVTDNRGKTFRAMLDTLVNGLAYHVIGVTADNNGKLSYAKKSFVRNAKDFGLPLECKRAYVVAFDTDRFAPEILNQFPQRLPETASEIIYSDISDILEKNVPAKYYLASVYLETLERQKKKFEAKGIRLGYRIINEKSGMNAVLNSPNTGHEQNLIVDPAEGIAGMSLAGRKSPLNDRGIRMMTPGEWARLKGLADHSLPDKRGEGEFSFPEGLTDTRKYLLIASESTVPVIKSIADLIVKNIDKSSD